MPTKLKPHQLPSILLPNGNVIAAVGNCARCGGDHSGLTFATLLRPAGKSTHWCPCPTTHEPILMRIEETKKKKGARK